MHPDQIKWDQRYRQHQGPVTASQILAHYQHLLPTQGKALDIACGLGGNALLLASKGMTTHAWDISQVAITTLSGYAKARRINLLAQQRDAISQPPQKNTFDVITVSYFLARQLFPSLLEALKPGGLIFYQTFTQKHYQDSGPGNPAFRLDTNELLQQFAALKVLAYHAHYLPGQTEPVDEACMVAVKG